ncbi:hypothetical protein [Klebsiella phage phiKp_21]|nr:hypothetical protein [Klebsiella phage phiKp_21]
MSFKKDKEYVDTIIKIIKQLKHQNDDLGTSNFNEYCSFGYLCYNYNEPTLTYFYDKKDKDFEKFSTTLEVPSYDISTEEGYFQASLMYPDSQMQVMFLFAELKKNFKNDSFVIPMKLLNDDLYIKGYDFYV